MLDMHWYDALGSASVLAIVAEYFLLQLKRIKSDSLAYLLVFCSFAEIDYTGKARDLRFGGMCRQK